MRRALEDAARFGHGAVLLVGDAAYYGRFGFSAEKTATLALPGADPAPLLAVELVPGALTGAQGRIAATGRREPTPALAALKSKTMGNAAPRLVPQAA